MWLTGAFGNDKSRQWCRDHGLAIEAVHQGGVNTTGGYLVPEVLSTAIIELVLQYGQFRANAGVIPMTSDTLMIPRRTSGLTAYFVGEGTAITESTKAWDQVKLITKDLGVTTRVSNQLASDAIISVMDNLAAEIALQFATTEDNCGFIGDGTSTYGGITGLEQKFVDDVLSGTASTAVTAAMPMARYGTGYAPTNISVDKITELMSKLPTYARRNAKWYVSPTVYWGGIVDALAAAGGVTMTELVNGPNGQRLMGYPVVFCESINTGTAANRIVAYFGDLTMAAKFGDRQQIAIASSDSAVIGGYSVFERNEIALRGVERFDINVHDVGSSTTRGPIVALIAHTA
jgi:HK97 family phage major capsid protein